MFVVRFAALIAAAVWLGGMVAPIWMNGGVLHDLTRQTRTLGYVCGGVVLVALLIMKFLGPPARRFPLRAGVVALMLAVLALAQALRIESPAPVAVNIVLGLVLLSFYAHE